MKIDITQVREQFPSLHQSCIFFDNPGGTQISKLALDRMNVEATILQVTLWMKHLTRHDLHMQISLMQKAVTKSYLVII